MSNQVTIEAAIEWLKHGDEFDREKADAALAYMRVLSSELSAAKKHLSVFTCAECPDNLVCEFAWDLYNTNGDCLATK